MGLSHRLACAAARGAHLLVVECPGAWRVRVAVEIEAARRGWRMAHAPADADVLLVCGEPSSGQDEEAVEAVWDQMPGPRTRIHVSDAAQQVVVRALDQAAARLLDDASQRRDAASRAGWSKPGMDHGGMEMTGPGGLALASGGTDRDGLDMDVLHLPLGPVLSHWPPGLVLTLSLQGDVVTDVVVERAPGAVPGAFASGRDRAARQCDAAVSVLALAGAGRLTGVARAARAELLDPSVADADAAATVARLQRGIQRSRALRWSLQGLAPLETPAQLRGDVHLRLERLIDLAAAEAGACEPTARPVDGDDSPASLLELLPAMLTGSELATVRLAVASVSGLLETVELPARGAG